MGTHISQQRQGDKDPVQAVQKSHGQKNGHGEQSKSALTMDRRAGVAVHPCRGWDPEESFP